MLSIIYQKPNLIFPPNIDKSADLLIYFSFWQSWKRKICISQGHQQFRIRSTQLLALLSVVLVKTSVLSRQLWTQ